MSVIIRVALNHLTCVALCHARVWCAPVVNLRLLYKELGRVCCSSGLERQLRRLGSDVHVFGHTHINWDKTHNGVRYVQHPLKVRAS